MEAGRIVTVHFAIDSVRGVLSFKCPPPGQWEPSSEWGVWDPVAESLDGGNYPHELTLQLTHDTLHYTPESRGLSVVAIHDHEASKQGLGRLFKPMDFDTDALIEEVTRRKNFSGVVVRNGKKSPKVEPGVRLKGDDAADLLRSALTKLEG